MQWKFSFQVNQLGWKIIDDGIPILLTLLVIQIYFPILHFILWNLDDEEANDYQPLPVPKSAEQQRFAKDKEEFKRKYKEQIDQVLNQY